MSSTSSPSVTAAASRGLRPPVLVGGAFALTTLSAIAIQLGAILLAHQDPYAPEGPIESIESIGLVGGIGLIVALAIALPLSRSVAKARIGAVVLGVLALATLMVFWSGAPAVLGASAAWLAGLARGGHRQTGAARAFGIIGFVIAILEIVVTFTGPVISALTS